MNNIKYIQHIAAIFAAAFIFTSCSKNGEVKVNYLITNSISGFELNYVDESGTVVKTHIETQSAQDKWTYSYTGKEGDIVYVSTRYTDIESAILVQIMLDGKVYKEGSSNADTVKYLTVSGTIPFE